LDDDDDVGGVGSIVIKKEQDDRPKMSMAAKKGKDTGKLALLLDCNTKVNRLTFILVLGPVS